MNLFEKFIRYLLKENIEVIVYFPPYEPKAYLEMTTKRNTFAMNEAEHYFLHIANQYHLKILGAYNPYKLNLSANDFIDDVHLKRKGIQKLSAFSKSDEGVENNAV